MKNVGVIGVGNMGSGLAKNLIKAGYRVCGHDIDPARLEQLEQMGGVVCKSAAEVGSQSDAAFVMVMNGDQAKDVILGEGLLSTMKPGGVVLLTATIHATEAREIAAGLAGTSIELIDSPVSGGYPGAHGGTLTLMSAGTDELLDRCSPLMEAVSGTIHRVGVDPGMGQTVKACLQSLIGSIFTATYEASVLAAKAGVDADALYNVISTSGAGCGISNTALQNVIDRQFEGTGSHISTMHKDLTIVMELAKKMGVPMFTASMAMQLFQAGITRFPEGDNASVTKVMEEIVGAKLVR